MPDYPSAITQMMETLRTQYGFAAFFAFELEWYVTPPEQSTTINIMHQAASKAAVQEKLGVMPVEKEKGVSQYEAAFRHRKDALGLIDAVQRWKRLLHESAEVMALQVSFAPKPFLGDYGSALQCHISLVDAAGKRQFEKRGDYLSPPLSHALGGLMEALPEMMAIAAPSSLSYARFTEGKDAPMTRSWGGNNRTVALRLPLKNGPFTQIECRIAGADADPAALLAAMLAGVLHGLETQPDPGPQIHGVAHDPQYNLPRLPDTQEAARKAYAEGNIIRKWLG